MSSYSLNDDSDAPGTPSPAPSNTNRNQIPSRFPPQTPGRTPSRAASSHTPMRESPLRMSMLAPSVKGLRQVEKLNPELSGWKQKAVKPDINNEELRVQISTLQYELENLRQEKEFMALSHEKELRELRVRADADFRKAQLSEANANKSQHKIESLHAQLQEIQQAALSDNADCQRRIRALEDENRSLKEDLEDSISRVSNQERQYKNQIRELEAVRSTLQQSLDEVQADLQKTKDTLQATQHKLTEMEGHAESLETENIKLKADSTEAESSKVLHRELSEQLSKVKKLEAEIAPLRKSSRKVQVIEEEKRSLENQLNLMKDIEAELNNLQIQKQVLEDERQSWASLLDPDNGNTEFDSPEAITRALVQSRIENTSLMERIGKVQEEIIERDEIISSYDAERMKLTEELKKLRAASTASTGSASNDSKLKARLERQRALALKEVEYLRAQLKAMDDEESTMDLEQNTNRFDKLKADHIANLESLLTEHRNEIQKLHEQLANIEKSDATVKSEPTPEPAEARGTKRPAEDDVPDEKLSVMIRKNRKLQDALLKNEQAQDMLKHELKAAKKHLASLQKSSRTRVLELKNNPTAEHEKVKQSTLNTLKAENRDLIAQLRGKHHLLKAVPLSSIESVKLEMKELERTVFEKEKRMRRLKEIWTAKSSEFREAVASLLGYKLDFLPNGRVRVTSMFHLSPAYRHGSNDADAGAKGPGDGEGNSIIFDGENGTMKISGGPNSLFAMEIRDLIKFWVEERKDIPCFLAAMTLDFYDKTTRALRH
ncbi:coiled-coil domain-containing protein mad1 [Ascosphaera aggregata]|nr:coiled-coil domain-containing protein mad1 [Ascosphaera aggregata]